MKPLLGYMLATLLGAFVIVVLLATALAFVPVLFLFAGFWFARPMTWESEFEHETRRLLKGSK